MVEVGDEEEGGLLHAGPRHQGLGAADAVEVERGDVVEGDVDAASVVHADSPSRAESSRA